MLKIQRNQRKILLAISILIAVNVILAANAAVSIKETKTYSAANYNLTYDDTKLAITNIDGLTYDAQGNIASFNLTIQNKDPAAAHSGEVQVSVSGQTSTTPIPSMNPSDLTKISVELNPSLPVSPPIQITATVILKGEN